MAKVAPRTLSGFMELLPADQIKMEKMMETLRKSYSVYGFAPLDTPVIESAARPKSRYTDSIRATATLRCALT